VVSRQAGINTRVFAVVILQYQDVMKTLVLVNSEKHVFAHYIGTRLKENNDVYLFPLKLERYDSPKVHFQPKYLALEKVS
jgi:hypothetical protein